MRCYHSPDRWGEGPLNLDPEEAHYLTDVMRIRPGQTMELFDGEGRVAQATVESVGRRRATVRIGHTEHHEPPSPSFCLAQALPKAQKMDLIVQKATELGVQRIQPLQTRHTVARPDDRRGGRKVERWRSVALAAARQSGIAYLPRVASVLGLEDWLRAEPLPEVILVGDLRGDAECAREVLEPMRASPPASVAFVIGPEGDFSGDELDLLAAAGARFLRLGDSTLRTETAALYAVGLLRYALR